MKRIAKAGSKRDRLLIALLEGLTSEEAAESVGVSVSTAWRWRQSREFQERLQQARGELLRAGMDRLTTSVGQAIDTLKRNLSCGNPSAEDMAAGRLIESALKYREQLDMEVRLAAVEAKHEEHP